MDRSSCGLLAQAPPLRNSEFLPRPLPTWLLHSRGQRRDVRPRPLTTRAAYLAKSSPPRTPSEWCQRRLKMDPLVPYGVRIQPSATNGPSNENAPRTHPSHGVLFALSGPGLRRSQTRPHMGHEPLPDLNSTQGLRPCRDTAESPMRQLHHEHRSFERPFSTLKCPPQTSWPRALEPRVFEGIIGRSGCSSVGVLRPRNFGRRGPPYSGGALTMTPSRRDRTHAR